jgi:hypothetical protein
MKTPEERIVAYRLRAEEVQTAAEDMRHPDSRATFLIARDYDVLADNLEGQIERGLLRNTL